MMPVELKFTGPDVETVVADAIKFVGPFAAMVLVAPEEDDKAMAPLQTAIPDPAPVPADIFPPSDNVGTEPIAVDYDYEVHVKPRANELVKKLGMNETKKFLQRYNVKRPVDLKPEQFAAFMSDTESLVSGE
jgi:hypothetical protein